MVGASVQGSRGEARGPPGKAAGLTQRVLLGAAGSSPHSMSSFIFHHGPEEDQAQRGCVTCLRLPSRDMAELARTPGTCPLSFRDSAPSWVGGGARLLRGAHVPCHGARTLYFTAWRQH